jgi:hypothetical protein
MNYVFTVVRYAHGAETQSFFIVYELNGSRLIRNS